MDLQELVRAFNSLPRTPMTQSGLVNNHWQFSVRHVPFMPPGDLLFFVNSPSRFMHTEGPAQILSLSPAAEQAKIVIPLLLKAFVKQMGMGPGEPLYDPRHLALAPWSWGTDDNELARALEEHLRSAGVCEELCKIEVDNAENIKIQQEVWSNFFVKIKTMVGLGPKCNSCGKSPRNETEKLEFCSGCKKAEYCSKNCQKKDWKNHKIACKYLIHVSTREETDYNHVAINSSYYYHQIAPHTPKAHELASEISLILPGQGRPSQGLIIPIRRLVNTGKDTPQNLLLFFGKNDAVNAIINDVRIEVFLNPPPGSPMYTQSAYYKSQEPSFALKPRDASAKEVAELQQIRDMQELIRRHMGSRDMSTISSQDMGDILTTNFAADWREKLPIYQTAVNAIDQGVPVGGYKR